MSTNGAGFANGATGHIEGLGTITGNLSNSGFITPGTPGNAGSLLITGNYAQTGAGIFNEQLGNSSTLGVLNIQGNGSFSGTLDLSALAGFTPTVNETFTIALIGGTNTGKFLHVDALGSLAGDIFKVNYDAHDITLSVTSVAAVPVPATFWLFGSALLGLTGLRKYAKSADL